MAVSCGMVLFQVINKNVIDAITGYSGSFSPEALKFAISALVIASPSIILPAAIFIALCIKESWTKTPVSGSGSLILSCWSISLS